MKQDQVTNPKIIAAVFDEKITKSETIQSNLNAEEEKIVTKYKKMLKVSIPRDAVEHKMKQDQVNDPKIIAAVFDEEIPKSETNQSSNLNAEEEKIVTKY